MIHRQRRSARQVGLVTSHMPRRSRQLLLISSTLWFSWLTMMLVHEGGHVIGALCTGGRIRRVVWHPAVISRTDVRPNPHPLVEVWAGPLIGSVVPLALAAIASALRVHFAYLVWVIAGFCLIANGAYIGIGAVRPIGDAEELIVHGTPRWTLGLFGAMAVGLGFWIWHRVSPHIGFGSVPESIPAAHAYASFALAVLTTLLGFVFGDRGI